MSALVRLVDHVVAVVAGVLVVALLLSVAAGVVSRGLGEPFIWTDEVARFLMVWLACFGWILAARRHSHIRVRFFLDLLPQGAFRVVEVVMTVATLVFGLLTAVYGWVLVERNWEIEATTVPLSMSLIYLPIVFAGLATALQGAADLLTGPRRPVRLEDPV